MKPTPSTDTESVIALPLFTERVSCGFPSPAADYIDEAIDLVKSLIPHPSATYVLRVSGDSMRDAAIVPESMLLVDSSLRAGDGDIVVARLSSGFTVKRLRLHPAPHLMPENPAYSPIPIHESDDVQILGVVTTVITVPQRSVAHKPK
ncbi:translesion error-prone DNA polymerase V autoproteolytic subunit [Scandinavium goeteborgense]|uniref:DNA polymerase V n=1 Tax=Scandinavium goeteborgense TaxID=1851514 RepID=A0A4R6DW57_SCAGO|nr:translesion error-prone DNA polymerase V autoproteolytic subunit [Scandinavium goeteborgense]TDN49500.1 DNA polymerase V [Scandinavium goeteborgense]